MSRDELWQRFRDYYYWDGDLGLGLDISRMRFGSTFFGDSESSIQKALRAMDELDRGGIANPDEGRMVGHYWLREPALAPEEPIGRDIRQTEDRLLQFAKEVRDGSVVGQNGKAFENVLVIGIGGSALGPQFVLHALATDEDGMSSYFFDNTDPEGMARILGQLEGQLDRTLAIVISKSGGTKETRNGMLEARAAYEAEGLDFGHHAVAITLPQSLLEGTARSDHWLRTFHIWDWVGGRTSVFSAVGMLAASLAGIDTEAMQDGARTMDQKTRIADARRNPAALLALMWFHAAEREGNRNMVILPYKDRLELFSKYLQQLVMESLGKELDLEGRKVNQGLSVFGNKGSTDQHAYVQQLRDGVNDFFVTFIEVLKDKEGTSIDVENFGEECKPWKRVTSGDYLSGFLQGTREALYDGGRESITITINELSPETVGALIALFERAVGLFASLVNINAYHQPGVEAGKKAAEGVLEVQRKIVKFLLTSPGTRFTVERIAQGIGKPDEIEAVFKILQHLAANPDHGVEVEPGASPFESQYWI